MSEENIKIEDITIINEQSINTQNYNEVDDFEDVLLQLGEAQDTIELLELQNTLLDLIASKNSTEEFDFTIDDN